MIDTLSAGFLLVKPVERPAYMDKELLPRRIVSACDCICPCFPGIYAIAWSAESAERRAAAFDQIGVPAAERDAVQRWATESFEEHFGWPGVFFTLDAAREARSRIFSRGDVDILGLGLPAFYRDAFVVGATPRPSKPGFAPVGKSGCLKTIEAGNPVPSTGIVLGFELLSTIMGQVDHSWLCNGLERHFANKLGIRPNEQGFITSLIDAGRCCEAIERGDVGAEPGPWFPWLVVRYDSAV